MPTERSALSIRGETAADAAAIRRITEAAFATAAHSSGTEAAIVEGLRAAGALTVSLVAEDAAGPVGHVAFSPVTVDGHAAGWFGLGPLSVLPDAQRAGVGSALVRAGLARLPALGGRGCVVVGDPAFYRRFGFAADPGLRLEGVPAEYFQRLVLAGPAPRGTVAYHPAFAG